MRKKLIGKFFSFRFAGSKYEISGVVLDYNSNWTLIRRCIDYSLDGFTIFKNEKVEHLYGDNEKRSTKILKLKKYSFKEGPKIILDSLDNILKSIEKKHRLIQLDARKGNVSDVVKYLGQAGSLYLFDELTTAAKWRYKLQLPEKECRFINFDNGYLNSLKLITKFK